MRPKQSRRATCVCLSSETDAEDAMALNAGVGRMDGQEAASGVGREGHASSAATVLSFSVLLSWAAKGGEHTSWDVFHRPC